MAKQKYRVIKSGLNLADANGNVKALEIGEEFSHDDLPEFWESKVEEVSASGGKEFEVATPKEDEEKKTVRNKK